MQALHFVYPGFFSELARGGRSTEHSEQAHELRERASHTHTHGARAITDALSVPLVHADRARELPRNSRVVAKEFQHLRRQPVVILHLEPIAQHVLLCQPQVDPGVRVRALPVRMVFRGRPIVVTPVFLNHPGL